MKYVIRFGKRLYLARNAGYVNNMQHKDIRIFSSKDRVLAKAIADDIKGELVKYEPKKRKKAPSNKTYQFTNYELENLVVLKCGNAYYTETMELSKNLKSSRVMRLRIEQVANILNKHSDKSITVTQLKTEVESKKHKPSKKNIGYYIVETRYKHYLTRDYKETERIKGGDVKKYDIEFGKSLAYADAEKYGGKVKKVYRGRLVKKQYHRKKLLRGRIRLIK